MKHWLKQKAVVLVLCVAFLASSFSIAYAGQADSPKYAQKPAATVLDISGYNTVMVKQAKAVIVWTEQSLSPQEQQNKKQEIETRTPIDHLGIPAGSTFYFISGYGEHDMSKFGSTFGVYTFYVDAEGTPFVSINKLDKISHFVVGNGWVPEEPASSNPTSSEATSSEATSSETTSSEATSSEATSSETTSSEATSSEATSSETTSSEATSSQTTSSEATSSETTSSETTSSETTSSEATSSQTTSSEPTSSEAASSEVIEEFPEEETPLAPPSSQAVSSAVTDEFPNEEIPLSPATGGTFPIAVLALAVGSGACLVAFHRKKES